MKFNKKKSLPKDIELSGDSILIHSENTDLSELSAEEISETSLAPKKAESFLSRIKSSLPHFEDDKQRKAGANIIRFLALMLILTLIARGTAGATLPKVSLISPQSDTIVKQVKLTGNVATTDTHDFKAPEGLTIDTLPVTAGEKVTTGAVIATFDTDTTNDLLARAKVELQTLQQKKKELGQTKVAGESETSAATRTLNSAQSSYSSAISARQARENELNDLQNKKNAQDNAPAPEPTVPSDDPSNSDSTPAPSTPTEDLITQEQIDMARQAVDAAKATEDAAYQSLDAAKRAVETAKVNDANAQIEAANTKANNAISMETANLDIQKQQKLVDELQTIVDNNFSLLADADGTILKTAEKGVKTDATTAIASIADNNSSYLAEAQVDKATANKLAAGNATKITKTDNKSSESIPDGKIIAVGELDPTTETAKITVSLPGQSWKPGESVEMNVIQSSQNYNSSVPISAIHQDNGGTFVYRVSERNTALGIENIVEKVPVQVLAKNDTTAAIEGAITPQDLIVKNSSKPITAGDKVRVTES